MESDGGKKKPASIEAGGGIAQPISDGSDSDNESTDFDRGISSDRVTVFESYGSNQ